MHKSKSCLLSVEHRPEKFDCGVLMDTLLHEEVDRQISQVNEQIDTAPGAQESVATQAAGMDIAMDRMPYGRPSSRTYLIHKRKENTPL